MEIRENVPLAPYTTFKIGGVARFFCVVGNLEDIKEAVGFAKEKSIPFFVLGGGSNVVVSDGGFGGLVIHPEINGIDAIFEDENFIHFKVGAGENWDKFVAMTVAKGLCGVENLSHIPGNTGAVAVQNVGAYGQEASRAIEAVEAYDSQTGELKVLSNAECRFTYRGSIFNSSNKGRYIILNTVFKLEKNGSPNLTYRDLKEKFGETNPSIQEVRNAVIEIRDKKFPFPVGAVNGNAGSFFKNPIVSEQEYERIREKVQENFGQGAVRKMEGKAHKDNLNFKIPAAFLVDICGLKNTQIAGAAINENQPLVIINKTGTAKAQDVLSLSNKIKDTVFGKTGVSLREEPELVGF
jgi:UDP-N-acetylmuramate dehydrogenase